MTAIKLPLRADQITTISFINRIWSVFLLSSSQAYLETSSPWDMCRKEKYDVSTFNHIELDAILAKFPRWIYIYTGFFLREKKMDPHDWTTTKRVSKTQLLKKKRVLLYTIFFFIIFIGIGKGVVVGTMTIFIIINIMVK